MEISNLVQSKFKMAKGFQPTTYHFKGMVIDMKKVDLETLELAVSKGFDVVEPIKVKVQSDTKAR
jgi:hypothetical protein